MKPPAELPALGSRVRRRAPPGEKGQLGHVVAVFHHGGCDWFIIGVHRRRWRYYMENWTAFDAGLWAVETATKKGRTP